MESLHTITNRKRESIEKITNENKKISDGSNQSNVHKIKEAKKRSSINSK